MALPTIVHSYTAAGTGASDIINFMPALHTALIAAGWSIEYADADAIGGGSAGTPAWDKTPSTSVDAGVVVYQMPANGHATEWYVRLVPAWGAVTARVYVRSVTFGATHDGSGGVSGGPTEMKVAAMPINTNGYGHGISASEDGFMLILDGYNGPVVLLERLRSFDGTVNDDIVALLFTTATSFVHYSAGSGTVTSQSPIVLGGMDSSSVANFGTGASIVNGDGDEIPIVGPFWPKGDPFYAAPRVAFLGPTNDYAGLASYERFVDGGSKTYLAMKRGTSNWARWMLATE